MDASCVLNVECAPPVPTPQGDRAQGLFTPQKNKKVKTVYHGKLETEDGHLKFTLIVIGPFGLLYIRLI